MTGNKAPFGVPPVERAIQLLRYIGDGNSCSNLSLAAREVGINRTTMLRLLETLKDQRLVEADGNNGFILGTGLIHLAAKALKSRDVVTVSQPELKKLATSLGLSAHLGIAEGAGILYLLRETPNLHLVSNVRVGSRLPLHATTIGRIILAFKDNAERAELLRNVELFPVSEHTATTIKQLNSQLAQDRKRAIAWSEGYYEPAIGSAAVALFDATQNVIAAINVTGPVGEFTEAANRRQDIQAQLEQAAENISMQLGYNPDADRITEKPGI